MIKKCELLAPAGDRQSVECAIYNGADAVYLGLSNFNARIKADNFNESNIAEVIDMAHLYGAKVYITINTLVKNSEVRDFLATVKTAVDAKADAFIIQDLGMAMLLKEHFKGIVLHASTQMGIHNLQGAIALQNLGFARVVLARETKLEDIIEIKQNTNLEIEYFVQGALCVAFSGNCYLSAMTNGNSGNRGKCLQLCRLPYSLCRGDKVIGEGYYLSPKDLSLMNKVSQLIDAGVDSLKIEGRLKRPSYVAQVVRSYRQLLDNKEIDIAVEQRKIQDIFSRGEFNENAYLYDNFNIINTKINNHEGKLIGSVRKVEKFKTLYKITLSLSEVIGEGDAIRLIKDRDITSIGVGNVNVVGKDLYDIFSTHKPVVGADVYLLKSVAKETKITDFVRNIPIDMHLIANAGKQAVLQASYNDVMVAVQSEDCVQASKTKPCTYDDAYKQVSKLNDTHYILRSLVCDMGDVFLPVSVINDMRRRVVAKLHDAMIDKYNVTNLKDVAIDTFEVSTPVINGGQKCNYVLVDDVNTLSKNIDSDVIYSPKLWSIDSIKHDLDRMLTMGYRLEHIYIDLPIVATTKEQKTIEKILSEIGNVGVVVNNYSGIGLAKKHRAIAGMGLNIYNSYTAKTLLNMGFADYIYSIEAEVFDAGSGIVYTSGHPTLMTLTHCPIRVALGGDCANCKYTRDLSYSDANGSCYRLRRYKINHCYFGLFSGKGVLRKTEHSRLIDIREV